MSKVLCVISHKQPLGNGRFYEYVRGMEYPAEDILDIANFVPVIPAKPKKAEEVKINGDN